MSGKPSLEIPVSEIEAGPDIANEVFRVAASDRWARIQSELASLPPGFRLAVSEAQIVSNPATRNFEITWTWQALPPGAAAPGAGNWTIFGPLPDDFATHDKPNAA